MNQRTSGRMNESTVQHPILDAALGQREEKKTRVESTYSNVSLSLETRVYLRTELISRVIFHKWTSHGDSNFRENALERASSASFTLKWGVTAQP